jgi:hypothetical protein
LASVASNVLSLYLLINGQKYINWNKYAIKAPKHKNAQNI